jgi:hypothetical protein
MAFSLWKSANLKSQSDNGIREFILFSRQGIAHRGGRNREWPEDFILLAEEIHQRIGNNGHGNDGLASKSLTHRPKEPPDCGQIWQ